MKTIRCNVFETNSSSEHVVTILNEKEYKDFESGKSYYSTYDGCFVDLNDWKKYLAEWSSDEADKDNKACLQKYPDDDWAKEKVDDAILFRDLSDESLQKIWDYAVTSYQNDDEGVMTERLFDEEDVPDWTKAEIRFLKRVLEDHYRNWNTKSWGDGYECDDITEYTTPSGDKIYVLSYSGYGN